MTSRNLWWLALALGGCGSLEQPLWWQVSTNEPWEGLEDSGGPYGGGYGYAYEDGHKLWAELDAANGALTGGLVGFDVVENEALLCELTASATATDVPVEGCEGCDVAVSLAVSLPGTATGDCDAFGAAGMLSATMQFGSTPQGVARLKRGDTWMDGTAFVYGDFWYVEFDLTPR